MNLIQTILCSGFGLAAVAWTSCSAKSAQEPQAPGAIVNPQIDYPTFLAQAEATMPYRLPRRIGESQFAAMIGQPDTVLLDARSADKFAMRHIAGAINLPFTDFTAESLRKVLPNANTRVLIYCNNNFAGDAVAFASKMPAASLNISTLVALTTYGYTNVYELAPFLDVRTTKLVFEGSKVGR